MLTGERLSAVRGRTTLFRDLSLSVDSGEALVLRGRNGSGKTTLLRMLAGLTLPAEGVVRWRGAPVHRSRHAFHAELLYSGHLPAVNEMMSARENLAAWTSLDRTEVGADALENALDRAGLGQRRNLPARHLSAGQRRRIGLARLLVTPRTLWLLDEPTTALDTAGIDLLGEALASHTSAGGLSVIATHAPLPLAAARVRELALR